MAWWKQRRTLDVGSQAPDFQLRDLTGQSRSLRETLAAGPAVLAFFKITCPVCQFTLPFLDRLHSAGNQSVQFIGISQDDADDTRSFNREFAVTFPTLLDEEARGYAASNAFGISVVPALFLIEPDGRISWTLEGFSRKELEDLGRRVGMSPFRPGEPVPEWKGG